MKILHIIQLNERNTYNLYKQYYKEIDMSDHTFLVMNKKSNLKIFPKFKEFKDFNYLPEKNIIKKGLKIVKYYFAAEHVIFNSLIFNNKKYILLFSILCLFKRNNYWVEWGGDLYNWKLPNNSVKDIFINLINYNLRNRMKFIGVTTECDEDEVKKQFPNCKKIFYTPLPFGEERRGMLNNIISQDTKKEESVKVQVAHNSLSINNHIDIINVLAKFSDNNMEVYLPLSYGVFGINGRFGGEAYRKQVIGIAKEKFNTKACILYKGMPIEKYLLHLWTMDIGIFGCRRPIGMANILYMLYMNKKVFLPKQSSLYSFLKRKNVNVFAIEDIANMTYEEFIKPIERKEINPWVLEKFIPFKEIKHWNTFFDNIKNNML